MTQDRTPPAGLLNPDAAKPDRQEREASMVEALTPSSSRPAPAPPLPSVEPRSRKGRVVEGPDSRTATGLAALVSAMRASHRPR
ncbi:MAG TPA: hypothetical protein VII63_03410 [Caulobacteraceae bacterium]